MSAAAYFARRVLTPDRHRPDDTEIRAVSEHERHPRPDRRHRRPGPLRAVARRGSRPLPGRGRRCRSTRRPALVERELLGVDCGHLAPGSARWNQYYFGSPPTSPRPAHRARRRMPPSSGPMPAWVVRPRPGHGARWAMLVHGRGARREETVCGRCNRCATAGIRRPDADLPQRRGRAAAAPTAATTSGCREWRDIEDAARYAVQQGAREVLLVGWSMGGAIVLQTLDRSLAHRPRRARRARRPGHRLGRRARPPRHGSTGCRPPVGQPRPRADGHALGAPAGRGARRASTWPRPTGCARADELRHRMLLIHSVDDEFVPVGPSRAAGRGPARPGPVRAVARPRGTQGVEHRPRALGDRGQRVRLALAGPPAGRAATAGPPYRRSRQRPRTVPSDSTIAIGASAMSRAAPADDARAVAPDQAR